MRISQIAAAVGASRFYCSRQLKDSTGLTFCEQLNRIRVRHAKYLLASTQLQIKEVSFEVGYAHPCELSRAFRKFTGMSPSAWRQRAAAEAGASRQRK